MLRDAANVARGVGVAFQPGKIDRAFFEAMALTEGEADELEFRTNVERMKQAAVNKMKSGQLHD